MACRECSQLCLKERLETAKVLISVPEREMIFSVQNALARSDIQLTVSDRTIEFTTSAPEELVRRLATESSLTDFQLKSVHVLVTDESSPLEFRMFRDVKTLYQYRSSTSSDDIAECLSARRVESHYQPIVDLGNGQIHGFEALARGIRSDQSVISPLELFKFADDNDAVFFLDRLTRETAIRTAAQLRLQGRIFINFMPNAIYDPTQCLKTTFATAQEMNFDPSRIVFEVIETERVGDMDHLSYIFDYYRHHGFKVALDDVGSGYSGLNTLIDLKPDIIKIDREIISGIDQNSMKQSIFCGLANAANKHQITVVAEGIETAEELEFVTANGADLGQGYYFAKPAKDPIRSL